MHGSLFRLGLLSVCLSGCAATDYLTTELPKYSRNEEAASNPIDRALADCPEETQRAAAACVKDALSRSTISVRALASSIPGCQIGSVCTYDHTTRRRLGLIPTYATVIRMDWRIAIDFRRAGTSVALLPVTVSDRNAFVVPPAK